MKSALTLLSFKVYLRKIKTLRINLKLKFQTDINNFFTFLKALKNIIISLYKLILKLTTKEAKDFSG